MSAAAQQQRIAQALAFQTAGQLDEAEEAYREILAADPLEPAALIHLSDVLLGTGRTTESVNLSRLALELDPSNPALHSSLCYKLLFDYRADREAIFKEQREFNRRHSNGHAQRAKHQSGGRIRVGYVSPDFYGHAECFFVVPLLRNHDRTRFEIHCYSSTSRTDKATDIIRGCSEFWHQVHDLSDDRLAEKIRADRIDILVDLTMHMAGNRLPMFAKRCAPVQVTWLAYPGGTGLDAMDYRLTDAWIDPPQTDRFYSEKPMRLPQTWICYDPLGDVPSSLRQPAPVRFGCFNNPCKLNDPTIDLFAHVLKRVTESSLTLLTASPGQQQRVLAAFAQAGVEAHRLQFVAHQKRGDYLRLFNRIDIALDPLVYNGITTTCDSLWMQVPVITCAGSTAAGRAGVSILKNVGLDELIAESHERYIDIAAKLAADCRLRADLSRDLRQRFRASPMMDALSFARQVESAYLKMMIVGHPG